MKTQHSEEDRPVPDGLTISEAGLVGMSIAAAFLTVALGLFAAYQVFAVIDEPDNARNTAQAFTPFLFGMGAVVTFLTVLWRGKITSRQADADAETALAELLEKGVERINEKQSIEKISLGVSFLETVAMAPNDKYARYALEKVAFGLIDIAKMHPEIEVGRVRRQAESVLSKASLFGRTIGPRAEFNLANTIYNGALEQTQFHALNVFPGMPAGMYSHCHFRVPRDAWKVVEKSHRQEIDRWIQFRNCSFSDDDGVSHVYPISLAITNKVAGSTFTDMHFDRVHLSDGAMFWNASRRSKFVRCDFNDTVFDGWRIFNECDFEDCRFEAGYEPTLLVGKKRVDIEKVLIEAKISFKVTDEMGEDTGVFGYGNH